MIDLSQLKCIGEGRNRRVYLLSSGKNVIKVPLNDDGISDNCIEDFRFRKHRNEWYPLARCRLLDYTQYILIMEYVAMIDYCVPGTWNEMCKLHSWIMSVDSGQVGYNRAGKLVAFDYGN